MGPGQGLDRKKGLLYIMLNTSHCNLCGNLNGDLYLSILSVSGPGPVAT